MTHHDLKEKFKAAGIKFPAVTFIEWAKQKGFKVEEPTVSRHLSGKQGVTIPWGIAYTCFFEQRPKTVIEVPNMSDIA